MIDGGQAMQISKQTFVNEKSVGSHRTFAGLELMRCEFNGSTLSQFDDPGFNLVVRDTTATRCVVKRSDLSGVRLENVLVDGLTTSSTVQLDTCVFRHVTLRGRVGSIMVVPPTPSIPRETQRAFEEASVQFYADVDWALDISEAEFEAASIYYVPGELVRRDPETQYLLRRQAFAGVDVGEFPVRAQVEVERFELTPFDSIVAVAPTRSKNFAKTKAALDELRAHGLAE